MDHNQVFPGEGWFLYWKTSASLWEGKIRESGLKRLLVPINWAFHSDTGDGIDFGTQRPETDLCRLFQVCEQLEVDLVFLLPLSPVPYLTNGGVPHLLARGAATNPEGVVWSFASADGSITKLFSFFDPRVYEGFARFVDSLGQFFSEQGISAPVWGFEAGSVYREKFHSYLSDSSKTFDKAFTRFLKVKNIEAISSQYEEKKLKTEFSEQIRGLYLEGAKGGLGANWEGAVRIAFLGGSCRNLIENIWGVCGYFDLFYESQIALSCGTIPSSLLLDDKRTELTLKHFLEQATQVIFTNEFFKKSIEGEDVCFKPLRFFDVFENDSIEWESLGLWSFMQSSFPWGFRRSSYSQRNQDNDQVIFCRGEGVDNDFFNYLLKRFLNGGSVIIDQDDLDEGIRKKLMLFILENSLKTEKVNKYTNVTNIILGDGRLILFEGSKLRKLTDEKKRSFWKILLSTYDIKVLEQENTDGLESLWFTREAIGNELNFEEIRRLNLYNRTSYKKKEKIRIPKNVVLLKVGDGHNSDIRSGTNEVEINLLPSGRATLDFGFYS